MASVPAVETFPRSFTARRSPPVGLTLLAVAVTALLVLPVIYLGIRSFEPGTEAWQLLARPRILAVVGRSLLLVVAVTAVASLLAVPIAWLLTRTDLPGRRWWTVVMALPLVVPSFVYALVAGTAPGTARPRAKGAGGPVRSIRTPSIYGFPGALLALALLTYPYVLLPTVAALRRLDPALEEVSRCLGRGAWRTFATVTLPALRPAIAAGALLSALYTLSDFGAVSLLRYETSLPQSSSSTSPPLVGRARRPSPSCWSSPPLPSSHSKPAVEAAPATTRSVRALIESSDRSLYVAGTGPPLLD